VLLGQELYNPRFESASNKWCDFGGSVEHQEKLVEGAAREFIEESLGIVRMFPEDYIPGSNGMDKPWLDTEQVEHIIQNQIYSVKTTVTIPAPSCWNVKYVAGKKASAKPWPFKQKICFLKQVPWQPEIPDKFHFLRNLLYRVYSAPNAEQALFRWKTEVPETFQFHPGFIIQKNKAGQMTGVDVNPHYLEKQHVAWCSLSRLQQLTKLKEQVLRYSFQITVPFILEFFQNTDSPHQNTSTKNNTEQEDNKNVVQWTCAPPQSSASYSIMKFSIFYPTHHRSCSVPLPASSFPPPLCSPLPAISRSPTTIKPRASCFSSSSASSSSASSSFNNTRKKKWISSPIYSSSNSSWKQKQDTLRQTGGVSLNK
jgi:hypothetical protein